MEAGPFWCDTRTITSLTKTRLKFNQSKLLALFGLPIDLLAILQRNLDQGDIFYTCLYERLDWVALELPAHIRKFCKIYENIVRFRFFSEHAQKEKKLLSPTVCFMQCAALFPCVKTVL